MNNKLSSLAVGDKVWLEILDPRVRNRISNEINARHTNNQEPVIDQELLLPLIEEAIVLAKGRKYLTVGTSNGRELARFDLETCLQKTEYAQEYAPHVTYGEAVEAVFGTYLLFRIKYALSRYPAFSAIGNQMLALEKAEAIADILGIAYGWTPQKERRMENE